AGVGAQRRPGREGAARGRRLAPRQVRQGRRGDHLGNGSHTARATGEGPGQASDAPHAHGRDRAGVMNVIDAFQLVVLAAFAVINGAQIGGLAFASRALLMRNRRASELEETALTRAATCLPVSFVVPAYNEEATIVGSVRSLLSMHYPEFELVVVNDGSKDGTMRVLGEAFDLLPT